MTRRFRLFIKMLLIALILFAACFVIALSKRHLYDWDSAVQEYVSTFNCKLVCLDSYEDDSSDSIIYKFQTDDDLQIIFDVRCFWGNALLPFGFEVPVRKAKMVDDFAEQICAYIGKAGAAYNIDDKSIEEISAHVLDTLKRCEALLQEYGIENVTPSVSFTFIRANESYTFKYGNSNETMLYDKLTELLCD